MLGHAQPVCIDVLIIDRPLLMFDLLLEIDTIRELGEVHIT